MINLSPSAEYLSVVLHFMACTMFLCGPLAFIRRYRIEEACRIIRREKTVKVSELALRVGFSHTSSFSRAFTTVMGETVLQYMDKVETKRKPKRKAKKKHNDITTNKNNKE